MNQIPILSFFQVLIILKSLFFRSLLFSTLFFNGNLHAQTTFQKTFGNENGNQANVVVLTNSGGYATAGWYDVDGLFSAEFYLIITDPAGDTLWTRTYGEAIDTAANFVNGSGNEGYNLIQTSDNGFLFVGERHKFSGGPSDVFIVKIAGNGDLEWSKTYGGNGNDYGIAAQETAEGDFVIGGYSESFGAGIRDMYLLKINSFGDIIWTKTYGGASIDAATDMQQTTDGGFILVGYTFSFGAGSSDVYVIKTDAFGDVLWEKAYGAELNDIGQSIIQTEDGGYIIGGESESFTVGHTEAYLLKINQVGGVEWSKIYGGDGFDAGRSVAKTNDGGYFLAGYTRSFGAGGEDFYLIKTDNQGDTLWTKTIGGFSDEAAQSVKQTSDNGYIIAGYSRSFGAGALDVFLVKADEFGNSGCHEMASPTIVNAVTTIENSLNSVVGQGIGTVQNTTLVGYTNTSLSNPCDLVDVIDELGDTQQFQIYPNPTSDYLYIEIIGNSYHGNNSDRNIDVTIYDILGEAIQSFSLNDDYEKVDVSDFPNGLYLLNLRVHNQIFTKKFFRK